MSNAGRLGIRSNIGSHGANSSCTGVGLPSSNGAGCVDLAENFPTTDESLQPGELVALAPVSGSADFVGRASAGSTVVGIISTNPSALIAGDSFKSGATAAERTPGFVPVALAGRVPVKVSLENGPIVLGDHLTLSSTPGVAMKAVHAGMTVGIAMEPLDIIASGSSNTVLALVNTGYWAPSITDELATLASLSPTASVSTEAFPMISDIFASVVKMFERMMNIVFENGLIKTVKGMFDEVQTDKLCVGATCVTEQQLQQLLQGQGTAPAPSNPTPTPTPSSSESPTPTPEATASPTPDPTPESAPAPDPTPESTPTQDPTP